MTTYINKTIELEDDDIIELRLLRDLLSKEKHTHSWSYRTTEEFRAYEKAMDVLNKLLSQIGLWVAVEQATPLNGPNE